MRINLTSLLLLLALLQTAAKGYSQRVNINEKNAKVEKVWKSIEEQTGYVFFYDSGEVQQTFVSLHLKDASFSDAMAACFKDLPLSYRIIGKNIIVTKTSAPLTSMQDKEIVITGTVISGDDGKPLPGVNVIVKQDRKRGVVTDNQGKYSLKVPENTTTLVFSFVGFKTREVNIAGRTTIDLSLEPDNRSLDAVQVVAYGVQKKESVVGAISTVSVRELKTPQRSLQNVLAGKVAGVIAVQRSGEPGADDAQFWIRGISTFGAGANPLILVDGVERPLSNIEPEEIETFSVLKDAAATAVYGIRGANGVVLVTTRRGVKERPNISFKIEKGLVGPTQLPKLVDGPTYLQLYNEAALATNPNFVTPYTPEVIEKYRNGSDPYLYPNVNWIDMMVKNWSDNQRANLNISGGGDVARYFVSASYYDENGIWKGDNLNKYNTNANLKRYNFRANTDISLNKNTELSLGLGGILVTVNYPGATAGTIWSSGIMANTPIGYAATYPNPNGKGFVYGGIRGMESAYQLLTGTGFKTRWNNNIQSDITLTHDLSRFTKGLKISGKFAFDAYNTHNIDRTRDYTDTYIATGRDAQTGELVLDKWRDGPEDLGFSKSAGGNRRIYTQANINYDRTFGDHSVAGLLLYNQQDYQSADAGDPISALPYRLQGAVGRLSYSFRKRYFFEFNVGYNGSENFEKGHRFGFFPAYAAGWIVSEEPFFKNNINPNALEYLKFRGSYGSKGNDQIGGRRFAYLTTVGGGHGGYIFGIDANNFYGGRGEDQWGADLSWEVEKELNLGLETRFLKGFYLQADVFNRHRSGIFLQRNSLPALMGLPNNPYGNLGEFENKGLDATLEYRRQFGAVDLAFRGNFTYARNKIIDQDEPDWKYTYQNRAGKRLNQPFGLIATGLFESEEDIKSSPRQTFGAVRPGDIKYKDVNGDGVIDSYDEVAIGNPSNPEIVYGFGTTIGFKGFDLSVFFQAAQNMDFMLNGIGFYPFLVGGLKGNVSANVLDRWTPENPRQDALFPRLSIGDNANNYHSSTWWQRSAGYLRLKTAEIGYTVPAKLTKRAKINTLRFYANGFNLFTWSKFNFWDPELGSGNGSAYPLQRNMNFGLNMNF